MTEFVILKLSTADRDWLMSLCQSGRGEFVAGYLMGRMFQEGKVVVEEDKLLDEGSKP